MSTAPTRAEAVPQIRPLAAADLPRVMDIERVAFTTPWRLDTFESLLGRDDTDLVVALLGTDLVGYAVSWTVLDQAELGNVAVADRARGRGVGRRLVDTILERVRRRGARHCFLEVRESNRVARNLYGKCGFEPIGKRPRYYSRPLEDALVMRKRLTASGR